MAVKRVPITILSLRIIGLEGYFLNHPMTLPAMAHNIQLSQTVRGGYLKLEGGNSGWIEVNLVLYLSGDGSTVVKRRGKE